MFGGRSGEHEVSVVSARAVFQAAREAGFDIVGIGITREGNWVYLGDCVSYFDAGHPEVLPGMGPYCYIPPDPGKRGIWVESCPGQFRRVDVDVIFPVLHGVFGEDGTVQGLLEMAGIPYVGSPVLASSICMDKDTTKKVLAAHGVPHVPAMVVDRYEWMVSRERVLEDLSPRLNLPVFVKPSGSGSSLGVSKVKRFSELARALETAFLYDSKALIEPAKEGFMEIECSVLGNYRPRASVAGQIVPAREFYDYEAKYIDDSTRLVIPAPISPELMGKVQEIAVAAFNATGCKGMARVDFFVNPDTSEIYVNELNTIPGFTSISMYPKLWEASGIRFHELVRALVELAFEKYQSSWREVKRL